MKKVILNFSVVILILASLASCSNSNQTANNANNAPVVTTPTTPLQDVLDEDERIKIETILADYIRIVGLKTYPNVLYDEILKQHKPSSYDEFYNIVQVMWVSEAFLFRTAYYNDAYVKSDEYCASILELQQLLTVTSPVDTIVVRPDSVAVKKAARNILVWQQKDLKQKIDARKEAIGFLKTRKKLSSEGYTNKDVTLADAKLVDEAGIIRPDVKLVNTATFKDCGETFDIGYTQETALNIQKINLMLKERENELVQLIKINEGVQKEFSHLLLNDGSPLLNDLEIALKTKTIEERKAAIKELGKHRLN